MIQAHLLGPHPLIRHCLTRLNVEGTLRSHLPQGRTGALNHGQATCVLVQNILTSPGPLYRLENRVAPIEPGARRNSMARKEVRAPRASSSRGAAARAS